MGFTVRIGWGKDLGVIGGKRDRGGMSAGVIRGIRDLGEW